MNQIQGHSNGKIILIGEHSVVYGKPAIALPFLSVEIIATIKKIESGIRIKSELFEGLLKDAPSTLGGIVELVNESLKILNLEKANIEILLESTIPSQRGFGSSAAVALALTKALFAFGKQELSLATLRSLVRQAEKIHHENPSGLDGDTIISKQAIYFTRGKEKLNLFFNMDLDLIVADTGIPASTKEAIDIVSKNQNKEIYIKELGKLTQAVLKNINEKDGVSMGLNLTQAHLALRSLGVSTPELDQLVNTALEKGALGAKLSGGGLGGCMIVLTTKDKSESIRKALINKGAESTWIIDLKEI